MATDTRSLRFESVDDAQVWRVFEAVERNAHEIAAKNQHPTQTVVRVRHSGGEFRRDSVAAAKDLIDRSGWGIGMTVLTVDRLIARGSGEDAYTIERDWVSARLYDGKNRVVEVQVEGDDEVAVNGAFAIIERAVNQTKTDSVPVTAATAESVTVTAEPAGITVRHGVPVVPIQSRSNRFGSFLGDLSVALIATVVGGLIVAGLVAYFAIR